MVQGPFMSTGGPPIMLQPPQPISREVINRIWSSVVKDYPYQSLQFEPSGRGAVFLGSGGPQDLVLLQPPLLQVRATIDPNEIGDFRHLAEKVHTVFGHILHQVPSPPASNLGVKLVFQAPAPGNDAVAFARTELIKGDEDLQMLAGGATFEASIKVLIHATDCNYTLLVEPLMVDKSQIYVDVDAQFPGVVDPAQIATKINQAHDFVTHQVNQYLDNRAREWGTQ
jgi:hypothetical protein